MLKLGALCLSTILLTHTGCMEARPAPVAPEVAMKHFTDQLANHCPGKQYDPEKFNEYAKKNFIDADTQSQQLIELDTNNACAANDQRPACYNTGFLQAEIQMDSIDEVVKATCHGE